MNFQCTLDCSTGNWINTCNSSGNTYSLKCPCTCPPGEFGCKDVCCNNGWQCATYQTDATRGFCCATGKVPCGNSHCCEPSTTVCKSEDPAIPNYCMEKCGGGSLCTMDQECCDATTCIEIDGMHCCGFGAGASCKSGEVCCGTKSAPTCCPTATQVCQSNICVDKCFGNPPCPPGETCFQSQADGKGFCCKNGKEGCGAGDCCGTNEACVDTGVVIDPLTGVTEQCQAKCGAAPCKFGEYCCESKLCYTSPDQACCTNGTVTNLCNTTIGEECDTSTGTCAVPTNTPVPTNTTVPTNTPAPTDTPVPLPTGSLAAATNTPAPLPTGSPAP